MNEPGFSPAGVRERDASAWQGTRHRYPEAAVEHAAADLALHAWLGRFTGHLSPAALALAWFDWTSHLLLSPDKQSELAIHAGQAALRWLQYCSGAATATPEAPVTPLAQDKRFADPAWERWPWNVWSQGFLLQQQWWHRATSSVRGMSAHHADVVTFAARQLLDCVAPSNFVFTNPVVLQASFERGGMNLAAGAVRAATDALHAASGEAPSPSRSRQLPPARR